MQQKIMELVRKWHSQVKQEIAIVENGFLSNKPFYVPYVP